VTAALAEKFLSTDGDAIDNLGALLEGYNDRRMATQYAEKIQALKKKGLSPGPPPRRGLLTATGS
jgi:hypothetical protein